MLRRIQKTFRNNINTYLKQLLVNVVPFIKSVLELNELFLKRFIFLFSSLILLITITQVLSSATNDYIKIEKIELSDELVSRGLKSDLITEAAIVRLKELSDATSENYYKNIDYLNNNYKLGLDVCYVPNKLSPDFYIRKLSRLINLEFNKKENELEIKVPDSEFSLEILTNYFRKLFGYTTLILKGGIIKNEEDAGYIVEIIASYNSGYANKTQIKVKNWDEAEGKLSLLLLKYTNPALYAYLIFKADPSEAVESLMIARGQLSGYKKISLPITLLGFLHLNSDVNSYKHSNLIKSNRYFLEARKLNPKDYHAQLGLVLSEIALEGYDTSTKKAPYQRAELQLKLLDELIAKNQLAKESYLIKGYIYSNNHQIDKLKQNLEEALKKFPKDELLLVGYASHLMSLGQNHEAQKNLRLFFNDTTKQKQEFDSIFNQTFRTRQLALAMYLRILATENDTNSYYLFDGYLDKCGKQNLALMLVDEFFLRKKQFPSAAKSFIQQQVSIIA